MTKKTWALFVQSKEGTVELGTGRFDSYEDALQEAYSRAEGKYRDDDVVGVRRPDVPAPEEEHRQRILTKLDDGSNGESVEDRRARARKILSELMADELKRRQRKKKTD
tara:strand:- start:240 stop:566 length:327 start_codon:yes stop_codon:yes gene_type:complete